MSGRATVEDCDAALEVCAEIDRLASKLKDSPAVFGIDNMTTAAGIEYAASSLAKSLMLNRPYMKGGSKDSTP